MATELELKLALTPERLETLRGHPRLAELALAPAQERLLDNTYYDTPEAALLAARVGLRIRAVGGRYLQTLKTSGTAVAGLHSRQEWELELAEPVLDLRRFPAEALPPALGSAEVLAALGPAFQTRFTRWAWRLRLPGGGEAELALDAGEILAGGRTAPICELELELLSGAPAELFALARELAALVPMSIANASKAERGYALAAGRRNLAEPPPRPLLKPEHSVSEGFARVLGAALAQGQAHELAFLAEPGDEDAAAGLAEALGAMRAALSLFSGPVTRQATAALRAELGELESLLAWQPDHARVRSLEQRLAAGQGVYRGLAGRKPLLALLRTMGAALAEGAAALRERLDSPRHACAQLDLGAWLYERRWEKEAGAKTRVHQEQRLRHYAHDRLNRLWRALYEPLHGERPKRRSDYRDQAAHLAKLRAFSQGLAGLYERGAVEAFCAPWRDLESGIAELDELELLRRLGVQLEAEARVELAGWLDRQEASLLEALEHTRRAALKRRPYWLE